MYTSQVPFYSISHIFSAQFLLSILIHALLHLLIVTVSACVCMSVCTVHHCTWACYLPATLLGLAVGQNILRALTFPGSPTPPSFSPFLRLLAIQEYASQVLGNLHAALLPSSTYSLILSLTPSLPRAHSHFPLSLLLFSLTFSLHLSVPHFLFRFPPCSSLLSGLWQPLKTRCMKWCLFVAQYRMCGDALWTRWHAR